MAAHVFVGRLGQEVAHRVPERIRRGGALLEGEGARAVGCARCETVAHRW